MTGKEKKPGSAPAAGREPKRGHGLGLGRVREASPFVANILDGQPAGWAGKLESHKPGLIAKAVQAVVKKARDEAAFHAALRTTRNVQMARIALLDLGGRAELDETLAALGRAP